MRAAEKKYRQTPKGRACHLRCRDRHRQNEKRKQDALENNKERNEVTRPAAVQHYRKWTDADLRKVWDNNYTDAELARILGRTRWAISQARSRHKHLMPEGYVLRGDKRSDADRQLLENGTHNELS